MNSIWLIGLGAVGGLALACWIVGIILVFNVFRRLRELEDGEQDIFQSIGNEAEENAREHERIENSFLATIQEKGR